MIKEAIILKSDAGGRVFVPVEQRVEFVREFERSGLSGPRFAAMVGVEVSGLRHLAQEAWNFAVNSAACEHAPDRPRGVGGVSTTASAVRLNSERGADAVVELEEFFIGDLELLWGELECLLLKGEVGQMHQPIDLLRSE